VLCAAMSSSATGKPYRVQCDIEYSGVGRPLSDTFSKRSIIGDGNCYFRCLSYALTGNENTHHRDLRQRVAQFERQNQTSVEAHVWTGDTVEGHISRVSVVGSYARETDILALAAMLNVNIYVYQKQGNSWSWCKYSPGQFLASDDRVEAVDGIYLVNTNSNHFDIVNGIPADTSARPVCDPQEECKRYNVNVKSGMDTTKLSMCEDQYNTLKKHCTHMLRSKNGHKNLN